MTNKEQILEEYDKKFDHFNSLYAADPKNKGVKDAGKQICDPICEKKYDLRDVRKFLSKALDTAEQRGYKKGRKTANEAMRRYNRTTKRMEYSKHRYHSKVGKKFDNCRLCNKIK